MKQGRGNVRGLCVSPGCRSCVACFNTPFHHLPHYRKSTGMAPVLISELHFSCYFSTAVQPLWPPPPPPRPHLIFTAHFFSIYNIYATPMQNSISPATEKVPYFPFTLLTLIFTLFDSFFFSCSRNTDSHIVSLHQPHNGPFIIRFILLSAGSKSQTLGFTSMSSTCTRLGAAVCEWEMIPSPRILIVAFWLAVPGTANLRMWL